MVNCEFSNPVYFNPAVNQLIPLDNGVLKTTNWNYTNFSCIGNLDVATSSTSTLPLPDYIFKIVSSSTPERSFYISNTIDLGQILLIGFLVLFFSFSIINVIKKIIFKK